MQLHVTPAQSRILLCAAAFSLAFGCNKSSPVPTQETTQPPQVMDGGNARLKTSRLAGALLKDKHDPLLAWDFSGSGVVVRRGGTAIPLDVLKLFVDDEADRKRIAASWNFDEFRSVLKVSAIVVDGDAIEGEREILLQPVGLVEISIADRAYSHHPAGFR